MKKYILFLGLLAIMNNSSAQSHKGILPPNFSDTIGKIVRDFRHNYIHIEGEALPMESGMDVYQSAVMLPGAKKCLIYRPRSVKDKSAIWQAVMYSGEDFKEAQKIYKTTFRQVKRSNVKFLQANAAFVGDLEPENDLPFAMTILKIDTLDEFYQNFIAEVQLVNTSYETWEVYLSLHNKKDDRDIRPTE